MAQPNRSIRWRLMLAGVATLAGALLAAGSGLSILFERHVERRIVAELETDIRQVMSGLVVDAAGDAKVERTPTDQRYVQPFSGRYWQLSVSDHVVAKSRSLWDESLLLPDDAIADGTFHMHRLKGPRGHELIAVERGFSVARESGRLRARVAVAVGSSDLDAAVRDFRREMAVALALLGVMLLAAFGIAVHVGLVPLSHLRGALARLHSGDDRRLAGPFPDEVAPLVEDLNKVLDQRERAATQAKSRAADLAHGLKTPLTAIEVVADELRSKGDAALGAELSEYVTTMQRHVERELALARSALRGEPLKEVQIAALVNEIVRSLRRLPGANQLDWRITIEPDLRVKIDDVMLTEVLGNLLDNARKWAASRISVHARLMERTVEFSIEDDGRGIAPENAEKVLRRGKRLDESVPGTGFGLAIVSAMLEEVGGKITLGRSAALGGLDVRVELPVQG